MKSVVDRVAGEGDPNWRHSRSTRQGGGTAEVDVLVLSLNRHMRENHVLDAPTNCVTCLPSVFVHVSDERTGSYRQRQMIVNLSERNTASSVDKGLVKGI